MSAPEEMDPEGVALLEDIRIRAVSSWEDALKAGMPVSDVSGTELETFLELYVTGYISCWMDREGWPR